MEYGLGLDAIFAIDDVQRVLILVLMEYGLGHLKESLITHHTMS